MDLKKLNYEESYILLNMIDIILPVIILQEDVFNDIQKVKLLLKLGYIKSLDSEVIIYNEKKYLNCYYLIDKIDKKISNEQTITTEKLINDIINIISSKKRLIAKTRKEIYDLLSKEQIETLINFKELISVADFNKSKTIMNTINGTLRKSKIYSFKEDKIENNTSKDNLKELFNTLKTI